QWPAVGAGAERHRPYREGVAGEGEEAIVAADAGHQGPVGRADALAGGMGADLPDDGFLQVSRVVACAVPEQGAGPPVWPGDPPQRRIGGGEDGGEDGWVG